MFDFTGKTVIVTGASGTLGTALSVQFAVAGANVVVAARTGYDQLAATLPGPALGVRLDVTGETEWAEAIARTEDRFGPPDVLVDNAAHLGVGTTESIPLPEFRRVLETNLTGALLGIRAAAPSMRTADFVLFAASDQARFATGSEILADGGFMLGAVA
ncbi:SDR family oxidoreductase [Umezawaea beigongshangensis]|uniref:SDR family oxidoreductase n=1 Tax=Umezawaea beigongshangensis TaxID=2780383 RepID=UPI0018F20DAB|nr:SDR family NAD(P)-dependent oxidoreductase [Umezawaea beigongshangensis]